MRSSSICLIRVLMLTVSLLPGAALAAGGMHKHDQSIANYTYDIQINTYEDNAGSGASSYVPSSSGEMPAQMMAPAAAMRIGMAAPDFQLARADGQVVSLGDVVAKGPTLVLFGQGVPAIQQMQLLQKNLAQLNKMGVNVVAVSSEPLDNVERMRKTYGITYDVLSDTNHYVAQQYGLSGTAGMTPSLYSIDQSGKILAVQTAPQGKAAFDLNEATRPLRGGAPVAAVPNAAPMPQAMPNGQAAVAPVRQGSTLSGGNNLADEMNRQEPASREGSASNVTQGSRAQRSDAQTSSMPGGQQRLAPSQAMPDTPTPRAFQSGTDPNNSGTNNNDAVNSGASNSGASSMGGGSVGSGSSSGMSGGSSGGGTSGGSSMGGGVSYRVPPSNPEFDAKTALGAMKALGV